MTMFRPPSPRLCLSDLRCLPALAFAFLAALPASEKPNVVLILTDDQGYGDATCYWPETDLKTPVMDRIAAEGIRFTQFRVHPLCAPTRASIMTGTHSVYNGMWRGPSRPRTDEATGEVIKPGTRVVRDDVRMLPEFLRKNGYATGLFGKWHLGYDADNVPESRGFDEFVGFLGGAHPYRAGENARILRNGQPIATDKHLTDLFADEAIDFIARNRARPFFCYLAFNAVHGPLRSEKRDADSARPDWLATYERSGVAQPRRDYNAVMSHADDRVGDALDALQNLSLEEKTLVIYLSDNGGITHTYPSDNGPLRGGKGEAWEGGIRVPAVMRWPGVIPSGVVSSADLVHYDLFTTIMDVAGISIPNRNGDLVVEGISFAEHLRSGGATRIPDRYLFWDLFGKQGALRGPWKIVADTGNHGGDFRKAASNARASAFVLVNLEDDLGEREDLSDRYPEIQADLKRRLIDWLEEARQYNPN